MSQRKNNIEDYCAGVLACDRAILGKAITLVESSLAEDQLLAEELMRRLLPHSGNAMRIGITGVPGVGKSTFIERLGLHLLENGHRVAVLAVDPSSGRSGGSILGDKTRMVDLSAKDDAFIRPSPGGDTLGGVARRSREALILCEAAGFDIILVETIGVGQSETAVANMTDLFLALMLSGAGDELQGIKRGLLELVNCIAVNKADGRNEENAKRAAHQLENALRILRGPNQSPMSVLTCSALENKGIKEIWTALATQWDAEKSSGSLTARRSEQQIRWMWSMVDEKVLQLLRNKEIIAAELPSIEEKLRKDEISAGEASRLIIKMFQEDQ